MKAILLFLTIVTITGCESSSQQATTDYETIVIDGCQYLTFDQGMGETHTSSPCVTRGIATTRSTVRLSPSNLKRMSTTKLFERFQAKLGPKDPVTGCIEWTGAKNPNGYGLIGRGRRGEGLIKAHRLAYELKNGPIPDGMGVLHRCDNPPCCNDEHLFLGNQTDNNADMDAKGRRVPPPVLKGEANGSAKLTAKDVSEIRLRLALGEGQRSIAASYGVRQTMISNINTGRNWKSAD